VYPDSTAESTKANLQNAPTIGGVSSPTADCAVNLRPGRFPAFRHGFRGCSDLAGAALECGHGLVEFVSHIVIIPVPSDVSHHVIYG